VLRPGLVKGPWTKEEDDTIVSCIEQGITKWSEIAARIAGRIGKQCRERWFNHLDPNIKKGGWSPEEDRILEEQQAKIGTHSWCHRSVVCGKRPGAGAGAVVSWRAAADAAPAVVRCR
jgi:hypothetical protein